MTLAPGCIVTCRQTGAILYTVVGRADDGQRWRLRSLRVDRRGRTVPTGRLADEAVLVLIRAAPTYSPGSMIEHNGRFHEVAADNGDHVELVVPQVRLPLRGGGALRLAVGNATTVSKADIILELLCAEKGNDDARP